MDWVVALGAGSFGFVVGAMVAFFVEEAEKFGIKQVIAAMTVFTGAGVTGLIQFLSSGHVTRECWFYPIGLAGGFVIGLIYDRIASGSSTAKNSN